MQGIPAKMMLNLQLLRWQQLRGSENTNDPSPGMTGDPPALHLVRLPQNPGQRAGSENQQAPVHPVCLPSALGYPTAPNAELWVQAHECQMKAKCHKARCAVVGDLGTRWGQVSNPPRVLQQHTAGRRGEEQHCRGIEGNTSIPSSEY